MKKLFFYGTLCHVPLLELVLGRRVTKGELREATLGNYSVFWADGQIFPLLVADPGGRAQGLVLKATAEDVERLNFYEGGFNYELHAIVPVGESDPVDVYFPQPGNWRPGAPWQLGDFAERHAAVTLAAAADVMALFGRIGSDEVARRLPMRRAMAAQSVVCQTGTPVQQRSGFDQADVSLGKYRRAYHAFFALDEIEISHRRFEGGNEGPLERAVFVSFDAAIVLPYDPRRDRVLLVEQFRVGPFLRGDPHPWTLEPIAGHIDAGETPELAAHREAAEEAGLALRELIRVGGHYPSPGASTEYYHCFIGLCDLPDEKAGRGGISHEGEDIRTHTIGLDALLGLVDSGEAEVGPLVLLALWLERYRARARTGA